MNGILNINKPPGMTSHDVVGRVRRLAHIRRVGHAGTLDPDATGVLLVCLGTATRIAEYLVDEGKSYRAVLALGASTSTEDSSGEVLATHDASSVTELDIRAALPQFIGDIQQIPPMVSAVHHEGKRLYELARQGITVERQPRAVRIDAIRLISFQPGAEATAVIEVDCGKGTYIRTLCAEIGSTVGVGGYMKSLVRIRVGTFCAADALDLEQLTEADLESALVSASDALANFPQQMINSAEEQDDISHGRSLAADLTTSGPVRILSSDGELLALATVIDSRLQPFKVFA